MWSTTGEQGHARYVARRCHSELFLELSIHVWKKFTEDIIGTVDFIHSKGWVHTDIKSNNIVLQQEQDVYKAMLVDFGRAVSATQSVKRSSSSEPEALAQKRDKPETARLTV